MDLYISVCKVRILLAKLKVVRITNLVETGYEARYYVVRMGRVMEDARIERDRREVLGQ